MNQLLPLIEPVIAVLMTSEEMSYAEIDAAFYGRLSALNETERDYVFGAWLKITDHEKPETPTPGEQDALARTFRRILRETHGDQFVVNLYTRG